jgi:ferredoxin
MDMDVFYFSGTGNSLAIARSLAQTFDARLIAIPRLKDETEIRITTPAIIIVFPAYLSLLSGVPIQVLSVIRRMQGLKQTSIHAVCNCGGYESVNALPALHRMNRILKSQGARLYSAHSLRMPMNNLDYDHIPMPINRDTDDILKKSRRQIDGIADDIRSGKQTRFRILKRLFLLLLNPLFVMIRPAALKVLQKQAQVISKGDCSYEVMIGRTDLGIVVSDACIGCGVCASVCPAGNIVIEDHRPRFNHQCEMCFACDEWCPQDAIQHWSRQKGIKYHHPEISSSDMDIRRHQRI